jgi:hypothetical protein
MHQLGGRAPSSGRLPSDRVNTKIIYLSPAYQAVWGRTRESRYENRHAGLETIHPDDRGGVLEASLNKAASGGYDEVYRFVRPSGLPRWVHDRSFPVKVCRIAVVAEDVSDRWRAEAARVRPCVANIPRKGLVLLAAVRPFLLPLPESEKRGPGLGEKSLRTQTGVRCRMLRRHSRESLPVPVSSSNRGRSSCRPGRTRGRTCCPRGSPRWALGLEWCRPEPGRWGRSARRSAERM